MSQQIMAMLVGMIIVIGFFLIVMIRDTNRFHIVEYQIDNKKIKETHKYVVISDLHNKAYGEKNKKLLDCIDQQNPEAVLIAGDILTAKPGESFETAFELIRNLSAKYPVYYGMGNHETRLFLYPETYRDMGKEYEEKLKKIQVEFLRNDSRECKDHIRITGLDLSREYYRRFHKTPMETEYLKSILGEPEKERYEILLAHNPDYFEEYAAWGADLVLSGHVHGGMVRIPFVGGVISPAFKIFPKYDGGMFQQGNSTMILSRGLGVHTIPVRIFNPGELIVLKLFPGNKVK